MTTVCHKWSISCCNAAGRILETRSDLIIQLLHVVTRGPQNPGLKDAILAMGKEDWKRVLGRLGILGEGISVN